MTKKSFKQQSSDAVMNFITVPDNIENDDNSLKLENIKNKSEITEQKDVPSLNDSEVAKTVKKQRINLFIDVDIYEPMCILMDKDRVNITKYINKLIRNDVEARQDEIEKAKEFFAIK